MISGIKFLTYIQSAQQNAQLMARIAINAIEGPSEFKVDLADLRRLAPINRAVVNGFLIWAVHQRSGRNAAMFTEATFLQPFRVLARATYALKSHPD